MKRILCFLIFAFPAFGQTLVHQTPGTHTASTATPVTTVPAPTAGNLEYLMWTGTSTSITISSVAQTNVVWSKVLSDNTNRDVELWKGVVSASAGTSVTITTSAATAAGAGDGVYIEVSGTSGYTTVTSSVLNGTSGTISPTITPASGAAALILAVSRAGGTPASPNGTPINGFTALTPNASDGRGMFAYQFVASASGSYTPAWTAASGAYNSIIVSFAGAGGTTNHGFTRLLQ